MKSELITKMNNEFPYEVKMVIKRVGAESSVTIWFSASKEEHDALIDLAFDCRAKVEEFCSESN